MWKQITPHSQSDLTYCLEERLRYVSIHGLFFSYCEKFVKSRSPPFSSFCSEAKAENEDGAGLLLLLWSRRTYASMSGASLLPAGNEEDEARWVRRKSRQRENKVVAVHLQQKKTEKRREMAHVFFMPHFKPLLAEVKFSSEYLSDSA